MNTNRPHWEVLLRLPGTRSSAVAARWLNGAFAARHISAHATECTSSSFVRVRANTVEDLERTVALVSADPHERTAIMLDARDH